MGQGSQARSRIQCSSILLCRCLAVWVFLTVMAEGDCALGLSYFLSLDVPPETGVISELAP